VTLVQLSDADADALGALARRHFGEAGRLLESSARSSLRLRRAEACPDADAGSRFGGTALLPGGQAWPATRAGRPLSFLAQVSTADIQVPAGVPDLPAGTLLAFFYEAGEQQGWGFDPGDRQFSVVIAVPAAGAVAVASPPGALAFPAYRMLPRTVTTIPDHGEPSLDEMNADYAVFRQLHADLDRDDVAPWHRMFGWPDLVQNPMQLECQLAANGIYLGDGKGYRHPRAAELAPGAEDWLLLLQLDTDDEIGWMWGDTGTIYYWIRRLDLLTARFDQAWMIFQCC
jgi:uncharacterized protein YwqG